MPAPLIDPREMEIKLGAFRVGSASQLLDPTLQAQAQDYKRLTGSRMIPLDRTEIATRIPTSEYWASRKLDGEFTLAIFRGDQVILLNSGGTVRTGLPVTDELAALLSSKKTNRAILAAELHTGYEHKRERVHDVIRFARGPESQQDLTQLQISVFDILELDQDRDWFDFGKTWKTIESLLAGGTLARPVPTAIVRNSGEIENLYLSLVEKTGGEGLVLRSNTTGLFKIKPRRTLEAVVIGFTESIGDRSGLLHDLLLALRRADGSFHVLCRVGGGFSEELRRSLLSDLKDLIVDSEYAEVNSEHEAYRMVQPKLIAEISCLDLISQSTRGASIQRMTLDWDADNAIYRIIRRLPLVSVISPQFIRFRDDKSIAYSDIRIEQVSQVVEVPLVEKDAKQMKLPHSQLLRREVFTKVLKGETMVRKFLMWKTNKQSVGPEYPAFVVHFTDFSPNRAQPLAREVRISNSADQIESLYAELKEENVKKGWTAISSDPSNAGREGAVLPVTLADDRPSTVTGADPPTGDAVSAVASDPPPAKKSRSKKTAVPAEDNATSLETTGRKKEPKLQNESGKLTGSGTDSDEAGESPTPKSSSAAKPARKAPTRKPRKEDS